MKRHMREIVIAVCICILGIIVIGAYFHYRGTSSRTGQTPALVSCAKGDRYDIMTGKLCPGATPLATTTASSK